MKEKIEAILKEQLPNFYYRVWENSNWGGRYIGIAISAQNYNINNVGGQHPQMVSLCLDLNTLELYPQIYGGNGGGRIYRKPNPNNPEERHLAMKGVKVSFRKPARNEASVLKAVERFCQSYRAALRDNLDDLLYQDIVNYNELLVV